MRFPSALFGCVAIAGCVSPAATQRVTSPPGLASPATGKADADKPDLAAGFHRQVYNGASLYCRSDPITGTRLVKKTICMNEDQYRQLLEDTRRDIEQINNGLSNGNGFKPGAAPAGQ
jgi:hypothetical protein